MNRKPTKLSEEQIHRQCVRWLKAQYPKVMFITDMSGVPMHPVTAAKMSALRSCNGFPDIMIFVNKWEWNEDYKSPDIYSGLMLELKSKSPYLKDGTLSKEKHIQEQALVHDRLRAEGWKVVFVWSLDQFMKTVNAYMGI